MDEQNSKSEIKTKSSMRSIIKNSFNAAPLDGDEMYSPVKPS